MGWSVWIVCCYYKIVIFSKEQLLAHDHAGRLARRLSVIQAPEPAQLTVTQACAPASGGRKGEKIANL